MAAIRFKSKIGLNSPLKLTYIEVPKAAVQKSGGIGTRLFCKVNGKVEFQCGLVALGAGKAYITFNKKRMKEIGVELGDRVDVELKKDSSKYGMKLPAELTEILKQDDEAKIRFEGLSPGKRRYIIFYVSQVKSSDKRLERAILLLGNLKKAPLGKETFRQMLGIWD